MNLDCVGSLGQNRRFCAIWRSIAAATMMNLSLCSCQFFHRPPEPEGEGGPPHPHNQTPHALKNLSRVQGLLDQAVLEGEASETQADAFRRANYPVIGPSYQHPQNLHLVPSLKNQGLKSGPQ